MTLKQEGFLCWKSEFCIFKESNALYYLSKQTLTPVIYDFSIMNSSLKQDVQKCVEEIHSYPGALRLGARTRYLARLIDATAAALSKHDQILVVPSTRFGKVRPNIPVCVACDRPLRSKTLKSASSTMTNNALNNSKDQGIDKYNTFICYNNCFH